MTKRRDGLLALMADVNEYGYRLEASGVALEKLGDRFAIFDSHLDEFGADLEAYRIQYEPHHTSPVVIGKRQLCV